MSRKKGKANNAVNPMNLFLEIMNTKSIHPKWKNQLHEHFKILSNTDKGNIAEEFFLSYLTLLGFITYKTKGDRDLIVITKTDERIEVKSASESVGNTFRFVNIRDYMYYDYMMCLAITPNKIYYNIWTKEELINGVAGTLTPMLKNQDTTLSLTKSLDQLKDISYFKADVDRLFKKAA